MNNVRVNIHVELPLVTSSNCIKFKSLGKSPKQIYALKRGKAFQLSVVMQCISVIINVFSNVHS